MPATREDALPPTVSKKTIKSKQGQQARTRGYSAEDAAAQWLAAQGLTLHARNIRYTFGEIDIVAWQGDTLVLCEVRLRKNSRFGGAAASVDSRKQARLIAAAQAYTRDLKPMPPVRIDVLAYEGGIERAPNWIQNALG